jgi:YVTN family beta-propeller protein
MALIRMVSLIVWCTLGLAAAAPFSYKTIDLAGADNTDVRGLNNLGQVVVNTRTNETYKAFSFDGRVFAPLPSIAGSSDVFASALNDAGTIVGTVGTPDGFAEGFLLNGAGYKVFSHPGYSITEPRAISGGGVVTGWAWDADDQGNTTRSVGFIFDPATETFTDIPVPGARVIIAQGMNALGQVVGSAQFRAGGEPDAGFVREPNGAIRLFQFQGRPTRFRGITDAGLIVGFFQDFDGRDRAIVGYPDNFEVLRIAGANTSYGEGINASGQISGLYYDLAGVQHGFIASPTPRVAIAAHGTLWVYNGDTADLDGWLVVGSGDFDPGVAFNPASNLAFVVDQKGEQIVVVDLYKFKQIASIAVPGTPRAVVIHPNGRKGYVATQTGGVYVIDAVLFRNIGSLPVSDFDFFSVKTSSDGRKIFAATLNTLRVFDAASQQLLGSVDLARGLPAIVEAIAISEGGRWLYAANRAQNLVSVVDLDSLTLIKSIPVGAAPRSVSLSPDGTRLYAGNVNDGSASVIDTATLSVVASIPLGQTGFRGVVAGPGGDKLFIANESFNPDFYIKLSTGAKIGLLSRGGIAATRTAVTTAPPAVVSISGLSPQRIGNNGVVTISIFGSGFQSGASVSISAGGRVIAAQATDVNGAGDQLRATFALSNVTTGTWVLTVRNPDGGNAASTVSIEPTVQAELWTDILIPDFIGINRPTIAFVRVGNTGNVDASAVPLWLEFAAGVKVTPLVDFAIPISDPAIDISSIPTSSSANGKVYVPLLLPRVPPGEIPRVIALLVTPTSLGPSPISVRAGIPLVDADGLTLAGKAFVERAQSANLSAQADECKAAIKTLLLDTAGTVLSLVPGVSCGTKVAIALTNYLLTAATVEPKASGREQVFSWGMLAVSIFGTVDTVRACTIGSIPGAALISLGAGVLSTISDMADVTVACQTPQPAMKKTPVVLNSADPNEKIGPAGVGSPKFVPTSHPLTYAIQFENLAQATAPAQRIVITDTLDSQTFDLDSFRFGDISFGSRLVAPIPSSSGFTTEIDLRPEVDALLQIAGNLDRGSGKVTWLFNTVDPLTHAQPVDRRVGFLPPNTAPPGGQGSIMFNINTKSGLPSMTVVSNAASIVFDENASISTRSWINTLDASAPVTRVSSLPVTASSWSFPVTWGGTDLGAGLRDFQIFVSDNGGPFVPWLSATSAQQALYSGVGGHTYAFYSVGTDQVGNREARKTIGDSATQVPVDDIAPSISGLPREPCTIWPPNKAMVVVGTVRAEDIMSGLKPNSLNVTVTSNETSGISQSKVSADGYGGLVVEVLADRDGNGSGRVYTINASATDNAGNRAASTVRCTVPHDQQR